MNFKAHWKNLFITYPSGIIVSALKAHRDLLDEWRRELEGVCDYEFFINEDCARRYIENNRLLDNSEHSASNYHSLEEARKSMLADWTVKADEVDWTGYQTHEERARYRANVHRHVDIMAEDLDGLLLEVKNVDAALDDEERVVVWASSDVPY